MVHSMPSGENGNGGRGVAGICTGDLENPFELSDIEREGGTIKEPVRGSL